MTSEARPLIALISATPASMPAASAAFAEILPEADVWNILDDRLLVEADAQGGLTAPLAERMARLIRHAALEKADGILLTCSMYGPVAHQVAAELDIPVYGSDDAAFGAALSGEYSRILLVASLEVPLADAMTRFDAAASDAGTTVDVSGIVAQGAFTAAKDGDVDRLADSLVAAVAGVDSDFDAVLLAQYSLAIVAEQLEARLGIPVLAGPRRAAAALRDDLIEDVR